MKKFNKLLVSSLMLAACIPNAYAMTKDETVYSTLNSNGSLFKTTVVSHLYDVNDDEIKDVSDLKEIMNINGNETFTINGNDLTWKNKEREIFYQGKIEKDLPIETEVTYYFDDKEITADDLVGKKGKVKIIIHFKNNDKHNTVINGRNETIYTPFVVTLGSVISNKNASNIEVTNGKVVNTGSKNFVIALASPGLYESLGMDELKDLDHVTISFVTENYQSRSIYVVATPKLIDTADFNIFSKMDQLYSNVDKLQTNMNTIDAGAKELENGANQLAAGSREISDNLNVISSYMKQLEDGTQDLDNGLMQVIQALNGAKEQLVNGDTEASVIQLTTLKAGNLQAIETLTDTNQTIQATFFNYGIDIDTITLEQLQVVAPSLITYKQTYDGNNKLIYLLTQNNVAIDSTIETTNNTIQTISNLVNTLGLALNEIESGANSLYTNTTQIRIGVEKLYQGSVSLTNGANALKTGVTTLSEGISNYNKEGIQTLSSYANQGKVYTDKLNALSKLTEQYKGFASDNSNTTTFVSVIK